MIEAVTAVARTDAVAIAAGAGANARRAFEGRRKRMRWLDALRTANGAPHEIDEDERDEAILEDNRQRIRAALDTIAELRGLEKGEGEPAEDDVAVSAGAVARLMLAGRDTAILAQAHLGAVAVGRLLG